ncbi:protein CBR-UNC-104 [Mycobacterium sp. PO1]|nr:protein CBR-UNC-104 [Mycobacterium sp. PO1]GFM27053.1 protein CBR-UNC-104 [Mycobacterium sp. PO2]
MVRNVATHTDTYEKLTRRVEVRYDMALRDVQAITAEPSTQTYPPTLEGALAAIRGRG